MGWSCINRMPAEGPAAFLNGILTYGANSVVRSVMVGSELYAAVRTGEGEVRGVVVLTEGAFAWKILGEEEGPYYWQCPVEVLGLLSPTQAPCAVKWRARCAEHLGLSQQAIEEAAKMRADLATATTLADLDQLYQAWIGYSVVADDPSATFESVRAILDGYVDEFVDACRQEVLA